MKRASFLILIFAWMACTETKLPPTAPHQAKPEPDSPPPQEIDDPSPGGGGSTGWDYTWVPGPEVNTNYGADCPGADTQDCPGHSNPATIGVWSDARRSFTWQDGTTSPWIPHLIDQNSKADVLALAKAMVFLCDHTPPKRFYSPDSVTYYDEVWHAIRNMMKDHLSRDYTGSSLCENGWIGMARNLVGYVVAADYLMSLGPVGTRGYRSQIGQSYESSGPGGGPLCNNSNTRDSLKTFIRRFCDQTDALYKAPKSTSCLKDVWLGVNMGVTPGLCSNNEICTFMASEVPDNKGAAAMASLGALAILGDNMQVNYSLIGDTSWPQPSNVTFHATIDSVASYFRGWAGDRSQYVGHVFPYTRFWAGKLSDTNYWSESWTQEDSCYASPLNCSGVVPILTSGECSRWLVEDCSQPDCGQPASSCDCSGTTKCYWGPNPPAGQAKRCMFGAIVEELIKGGFTSGEPLGKPSNACALSGCPPNLINDVHIAGTVNYLMNTAELLYQGGINLYGHNGSTVPHAAYFYVDWVNWAGWTPLTSDDDWPCTFVLRKRGYTSTDCATPGNAITASRGPSMGKQMSFTDLTHP